MSVLMTASLTLAGFSLMGLVAILLTAGILVAALFGAGALFALAVT